MTSDEIISFLVNGISFKQDDNEHNSFYKECPIGGNELVVVRISNHRTYLQTWADRYKPTILPNKKVVRRMGTNLPLVNRIKHFYSFVFEDEQDTVGNNSVKNGRRIKVIESVNKSAQFTTGMLNGFATALRQLCSSNQYDSSVLGEYEVVTTTTSEGTTDNNNDIKTENYMRNNKRTIRLTESDLHRVIKESVKRILKEAAYNGNHVGRDNGNGRFEMTHPEGKYSLYFDKAQRDAHNYNAQQQGQIPNPYAGWSKRVNDGNGNWSDAEFNGEDMHMYTDDDATTTAQNLRQYDPNGAYHWDMFRGHGDQYRQS